MVNQPLALKMSDLHLSASRDARELRAFTVAVPEIGSVFGVFALERGTPDVRSRAAHTFISRLETLAAEIADGNPVRRFENTLARLNDDIPALLEEARGYAPKLSAVIGITTNHQLFISGCGDISALFLHKTADRRFSIYELHAQFRDQLEQSDTRPFMSILDGELAPGDVFYAGTLLVASLKQEEMHDILVTLPPQGALERLGRHAPPLDGFAGVCVSVIEERRGGKLLGAANPIGSLAELSRTQSETKDALGEAASAHPLENLVEAGRGSTLAGRRDARAIAGRLASVSGRAAAGGLSIIGRAWQAVSPFVRSGLRGALRQLGPVLRNRKTVRALGVIAAVLVLGLITNRVLAGRNAKNNEAFVSATKAVEDRLTSAQAKLLYKDIGAASTDIEQAKALLLTIPSDTADRKKKKTDLENKVSRAEAALRGETTVSVNVIATTDKQLAAAAVANNTVYALSQDLTALRLNTLEKNFTEESISRGTVTAPIASASDSTGAYFLGAGNELSKLDPAAKTLNPLTSGTNKLPLPADIFAYNGNMYVLARGSEQIVRMRPQLGGFDAGTPWITQKNQSLADARAIAIDGDVYVATPSSIIKFRQGREIDFTVSGLGALKNPIDLWTIPESKYLYLLDSGVGRLIVIDKATGNVTTQYVAPELNDAVAMRVEESSRTATVITKTSAISFPLEHLLQ